MKMFLETILNFIFPARPDKEVVDNLTFSDLAEKLRGGTVYENITALFPYRDPKIKSLLWEIKYRDNPKAVSLSALALSDFLVEEASEESVMGAGGKIILVPVPSSKERFSERGFNPAEKIAKALREQSPELFEVQNLLVKFKETKKQTDIKEKEERERNVVGCFKLAKPIQNTSRKIIVIDDVVTTGATLNEAMKVLRQASAEKVEAVAIAH